jgi:threonine synthase
MIGNPVSMPRVIEITKKYNETSKRQNVFFIQVTEQSIMDWQLLANKNGHIACTQGGECLAGLVRALDQGVVLENEVAILDATAHAIKFSEFQDLYFKKLIPDAYDIQSDPGYINQPQLIASDDPDLVPSQENRLSKKDFQHFVQEISEKIAKRLNLASSI